MRSRGRELRDTVFHGRLPVSLHRALEEAAAFEATMPCVVARRAIHFEVQRIRRASAQRERRERERRERARDAA